MDLEKALVLDVWLTRETGEVGGAGDGAVDRLPVRFEVARLGVVRRPAQLHDRLPDQAVAEIIEPLLGLG